ncbi:hypothetical protein Rleg4DRAFT_5956 [Rhizobium leguminosarum bv. trifolii WSM2297]|uniref:Uncharacterized protein n=1 Tax=Rhizobium leguminosarum bv. trifolii WSM2297 TaxID=754762 RepID=J0L1V0_RHILT|nr:hypothetical protein Rleg4DRAFT_5956 [Rhizobium leguminosarum bv. trifolii WSM2297]
MREIFENYPLGCAAAATHDIWSDGDIAVTSDAARLLYGSNAKTAAAWCALGARSDGRSGDFRFWVRVFKHLSREGAATSSV